MLEPESEKEQQLKAAAEELAETREELEQRISALQQEVKQLKHTVYEVGRELKNEKGRWKVSYVMPQPLHGSAKVQ